MCQGNAVDTVLFTIDITEDGTVVRWTASDPDGRELEDWLLEGRFLDATRSHSWTVDRKTYLVVRDVLRYLNDADWEPDTIL